MNHMTAYRGRTRDKWLTMRPRGRTWRGRLRSLRRRFVIWTRGPWKERKWRCRWCHEILHKRGQGARIQHHAIRCMERMAIRQEFAEAEERRVDPELQKLYEVMKKTGFSVEEAVEHLKAMAIMSRGPEPTPTLKKATALGTRGPLTDSIQKKVVHAKRHHLDQIFIDREEWNELFRQGLVASAIDHTECTALGLRMVVVEPTDLTYTPEGPVE